MGTVVARKRASGSVGYTAQILLKKAGEIVWREAKTFDRKAAAQAWHSTWTVALPSFAAALPAVSD